MGLGTETAYTLILNNLGNVRPKRHSISPGGAVGFPTNGTETNKVCLFIVFLRVWLKQDLVDHKVCHSPKTKPNGNPKFAFCSPRF